MLYQDFPKPVFCEDFKMQKKNSGQESGVLELMSGIANFNPLQSLDEVKEEICYPDYRKTVFISAFTDRTVDHYDLLYLII